VGGATSVTGHRWRAAAVLTLVGALFAGLAAGASPDAGVVAEVRRHTERYLDVATARAEGFVQASGMRARHGIHFVDPRAQLLAATLGFDLCSRAAILRHGRRPGYANAHRSGGNAAPRRRSRAGTPLASPRRPDGPPATPLLRGLAVVPVDPEGLVVAGVVEAGRVVPLDPLTVR